jgi:hypothetical protein
MDMSREFGSVRFYSARELEKQHKAAQTAAS